MNLDLTVHEKRVSIYQPEHLKEGNMKVLAFVGRNAGDYSHTVSIEMINETNDGQTEAWAGFELNKNQARYLRDFLTSFLREKKINIEDDD